jgi:hypothetical protein
MATTISTKLRIKAGQSLLTINAPGDFKKGLEGLPDRVKVSDKVKDFDQIHWFILNRVQLEKELSKIMKLIRPGVIVWAYYPKGSSKIQTDLTRDKGWDCLLQEDDKLAWINLISFNDTWSVFGFRAKTEKDKLKDAQPKREREIFNWVNQETREVRLPGDLIIAFTKNKNEATRFENLSFTNKKEWIEWIVTARREKTRSERVKGTIERLSKGWKNPRNM